MRKTLAILLSLTWAGLSAGPAAGQTPRTVPDTIARFDLPEIVAQAVVDFFNDPRRTRFEGDHAIAPGEVFTGDLALLEGVLVVGGRLEGSAVVVNGRVELLPGAVVTGDLLVVGGRVTGAEEAVVHGEILAYPERLSYRREGSRIRRDERRRTITSRSGAGGWGGGDFLITTGKSYNRVEGLPITFGPRIETAGSNPFRIHALGIYRTESGFTLDTDRMGYYVRAEQFMGGHREIRLGATAHSLVDPIEEWHLSDLENGLSTFLFHRDFRDHYERRGVSFFGAWEPRPSPVALAAEVRWERHRALPSGSPWTLFSNAEPWRPQPLIAEGRIGSMALSGTYDTRSRTYDPATGWFIRTRVEEAFRVALHSPEMRADVGTLETAPLIQRYEGGRRFSTGTLDVRRYNRLDPQSRLDFRLLTGGSLRGEPLPPQRQHALGGEGSLPGYQLFSLDCGARARVVHRDDTPGLGAHPYFPQYGCDAFALLQAEFRGKLAFRLQLDSAPWEDGARESHGWGLDLDIRPDWVVFTDAGRGWSFDPLRPDEELAVDVGLGLLVNRFGFFVAKPLTRGGGLNVFVRLGPRF